MVDVISSTIISPKQACRYATMQVRPINLAPDFWRDVTLKITRGRLGKARQAACHDPRAHKSGGHGRRELQQHVACSG